MDSHLQQQLQLQLQLQLYHSIAVLLQQHQQQQQQQQQQQPQHQHQQPQNGYPQPAPQQRAGQTPHQQLGAQPTTQNNPSPSSTLLAKLSAVTSSQHLQPTNMSVQAPDPLTPDSFSISELDRRIEDFLNALFSINDDPEPAAIEMIAKRINATSDSVADWFDKKRLKLNSNASSSSGAASPRSQSSLMVGNGQNSGSNSATPLANPAAAAAAKKREGGRVVTFSEYQRSLLEAIFEENNYLHPQEYEELSSLIQVPSRNIKIWFKNRRSKQRLSGRGMSTGAKLGHQQASATQQGASIATTNSNSANNPTPASGAN